MIPTVEEIEDYLQSIEGLFYSTVYSATPDLPNFREAVHRLWIDVSRYGPGLPASFPEIPGLGVFEVPPPPPPVPKSWLEGSTHWVGTHPWTTSGIVVGALGAGLLVSYGVYRMKEAGITKIRAVSKERRQVVVILGGDMPLGSALIADLEKKGYIVITSVSTPEAVDAIEHECHGYVRALVLDPTEPATIPIFLRSLTSTLSRRFPTTASGDPHASPSLYPYVHSVISLLTLPTPIVPAPLEHISLRNAYLPYLNATHITPLQVLQALLPLLRTTPARSRDSANNYNGRKTIIVCLPATDARVGLPFSSAQAMSAAATLRGVEVLRREINAAAITDKSESMKNIKVVVVDIGAVNADTSTDRLHSLSPHDVYKAMEDWTASEKLTYGPAFASISRSHPLDSWYDFSSIFSNKFQFGVRRKSTQVGVFVDTLVGVVSGGRYGLALFGYQLGLGRITNWIRGERFSIGAGATTYRLASHLPSFLLDALLNIPHFLVSVRNALLPIPPPIVQPPPPMQAAHAPIGPARDVGEKEVGNDNDAGSEAEADVESNSGESESWVSLNQGQDKVDE